MQDIIDKNKNSYYKEDTAHNAVSLILNLRTYAMFTINERKDILDDALGICIRASKDYPSDLRFFMLLILLNLDLENYAEVKILLKKTGNYTSYYKSNIPVIYVLTLYFEGKMKIGLNKMHEAKKVFNKLFNYNENDIGVMNLLLGDLLYDIKNNDRTDSMDFYLKAYENGCNSRMYYINTYTFLSNNSFSNPKYINMITDTLNWAAAKNLDISKILIHLSKDIEREIYLRLKQNTLKYVYNKYNDTHALKNIIKIKLLNNDSSDEAASYYKMALKDLLKSSNIPLDVKSVLYKIAIEDAQFKEMRESLTKEIVAFALDSLAKNKKYKQYDIIYKYAFDILPDNDALSNYFYKENFTYKIENINAQGLFLYHPLKSKMDFYNVRNKTAEIKAPDSDFKCYFFYEDTNEFININDAIISKSAALLNEAQLANFYKNGKRDAELLSCLANKYINGANLNEQQIQIIKDAMALEDVSNNFKYHIYETLAHHYFSANDIKASYIYYAKLFKHDVLSNAKISEALEVFLALEEFEQAANLIVKSEDVIPPKELFHYIKKLGVVAYTPAIAKICYNLIVIDWYDKEIIKIFLSSYNGSLGGWATASDKLDKIGEDTSGIYEKIIENGIWSRRLDDKLQEAYLRHYARKGNDIYSQKFLYYLLYEIIKNDANISDDIAIAMQKIYEGNDQNEYLQYAIAILYMRGCLNKEESDYIIKKAAFTLEKKGVVLTQFKRFQDKKNISSYIEKNIAFDFHYFPGKNVFLYYKRQEADVFARKQMKYFKFGIYTANLCIFYDERVIYYFGNDEGALTAEMEISNNNMRISEDDTDIFFKINNALIYKNMMMYDEVENIIESVVGRQDLGLWG